MGHPETAALIESKLRAALNPTEFQIVDESHLHAGHAGARGGGGHFRVRIVSQQFQGQNRLARQRAVYGALGTMMEKEIHALSMACLSPEEAVE
jgi:BolA family transcriptional regulator, general stress-responsive regulator